MKQFIKKHLGLVLMAVTLVFGSSVIAQGPGGGNGQPGPAPTAPTAKQVKKMISAVTKQCALNEEQEASVTTIFTDHFDDIREAMEAGRPSRDKMEALKTKFQKDVNAVLTEDQQKKFTVYIEKNYPGPGNQGPKR